MQRRNHGSTSFYQNWASYKDGFGNHDEDFWLGNEKLHYLTTQKDYKLRFDVITSRGWPKYAEYAEFKVESENDNYRMSKLGVRSGDTGIYSIIMAFTGITFRTDRKIIGKKCMKH